MAEMNLKFTAGAVIAKDNKWHPVVVIDKPEFPGMRWDMSEQSREFEIDFDDLKECQLWAGMLAYEVYLEYLTIFNSIAKNINLPEYKVYP